MEATLPFCGGLSVFTQQFQAKEANFHGKKRENKIPTLPTSIFQWLPETLIFCLALF